MILPVRRGKTYGTMLVQEQKVSDPLHIQADGTELLEEPLESPRHLTWLLLRDQAGLNEPEQRMLAFIRQERTIEVAYDLVQRFGTMVRSRQQDQLDPGLRMLSAAVFLICTVLPKGYNASIPHSRRPSPIRTVLVQWRDRSIDSHS